MRRVSRRCHRERRLTGARRETPTTASPGPPPHPRGRRRGAGCWRARRPRPREATDRSRRSKGPPPRHSLRAPRGAPAIACARRGSLAPRAPWPRREARRRSTRRAACGAGPARRTRAAAGSRPEGASRYCERDASSLQDRERSSDVSRNERASGPRPRASPGQRAERARGPKGRRPGRPVGPSARRAPAASPTPDDLARLRCLRPAAVGAGSCARSRRVSSPSAREASAPVALESAQPPRICATCADPGQSAGAPWRPPEVGMLRTRRGILIGGSRGTAPAMRPDSARRRSRSSPT
ncbi:uncharacterized protein SOCE26_078220 [Sorangium cellulosum]|uniref:Uncharacterized protein n=1 Tax=Sorangium cellulosum TaxID=56 RepID=A0A2L0F461_SORCE|nr:uncharacterized protein SOCE26_078220 [Sorangium cellulosum]